MVTSLVSSSRGLYIGDEQGSVEVSGLNTTLTTILTLTITLMVHVGLGSGSPPGGSGHRRRQQREVSYTHRRTHVTHTNPINWPSPLNNKPGTPQPGENLVLTVLEPQFSEPNLAVRLPGKNPALTAVESLAILKPDEVFL